MFVYCNNTPISGYDPHGEFDIIGAAAGFVVGAAVSMTSYILSSGGDINLSQMLVAGGVGGISGIAASVSIKGAAVAGIIGGIYTFFTSAGSVEERVWLGLAAAGCAFVGGSIAFTGCDKLLQCVKDMSKVAYGVGSAFINYSVGEIADITSVGVQAGIKTKYDSTKANKPINSRTITPSNSSPQITANATTSMYSRNIQEQIYYKKLTLMERKLAF